MIANHESFEPIFDPRKDAAVITQNQVNRQQYQSQQQHQRQYSPNLTTTRPSTNATTDSFDTLQISTDPTIPDSEEPIGPTLYEPLGWMPLRHEPNQNEFLVDILLGSSEVARVNSLILDTTGEYLLLFAQPTCSGAFKPPITDCFTPNTIFQNPFSHANFYIDAQKFYCTTCYVGTDQVGLMWTRNGSQLVAKYANTDIIVAAKLAINGTEPVPPLYTVTPFRGLFGLGSPSSKTRPISTGDYRRPFSDLISILISGDEAYPSTPTFATDYSYGLDLYLHPSNATSQSMSLNGMTHFSTKLIQSQSKLYLNGVPKQFQNQIQWSLHPSSSRSDTTVQPVDGKAVTPTPVSYPIFLIYNVRVCGVQLYPQLRVIVDTMSPCLGVPTPLFDSLISWLPLECDHVPTNDGNRQCYYSSQSLQTARLPTLSFSMDSSDSTITPRPQLYLPLEHLLLSSYFTPPAPTGLVLNYTNTQRLCIMASPDRQYINLGNIPLSAFYFHRDFKSGYTGLANKAAQQAQNNQCLPRLECIGQESSYTAYNYCYPPTCSIYWLFSYQHATRTCELNPGYPIIMALAVAIFFAIEAWFFYSEEQLDYNITHTMPKMTLVQRSESRRYRRPAPGEAPPPLVTDDDVTM